MRFATAQKQGIAYLQSDEFKTREDAESTIPSIPILIEITKNGLVTDNSQEGLIVTGFNDDSGRYYRIEERAYVTGVMKTKEAYAFVTKFNETTDKIAFVIHADSSKEFKKKYMGTDPIPNIPVTKSGSSEKGLKFITQMHSDTKIPLVLPAGVFGKPYNEITEEVEEVAVIDPVYGRKAASAKGLYKAILQTLKDIQA